MAANTKEIIHDLEELNELRFEVASSGPATLELLTGEAEIFGTELIHNRVYTFHAAATCSVFTYKTCTVKISFADMYFHK
ncbi:CLP1 [Bugula neritina]|uniref:CLP1 n=1 Tax=Bugula neritina TaxID=10212 RepID=A0A7J7IV90_BUGNE|nr:CLP1 [Bugula neritina]